MRPVRVPRFDVHDQQLIEQAHITGRPAHIARAVAAAVDSFQERLRKLPSGFPIVEGRPSLMVKKPGNFFDSYIIALTLQKIADSTGVIVDLYKAGEEIRTDEPASPDVTFQ